MMDTAVIDISMPLEEGLPVWPGSPGMSCKPIMRIADGDPVNSSCLEMDVHCGTHIDAPLHFFRTGPAVDEIPLSNLNGAAWVADCGDSAEVDRNLLEKSGIPEDTLRLLLKTRNSVMSINREAGFSENYCALTPDAADWVTERGLKLVGIDYLSIQRFQDPPDVHLKLLSAEVTILEGLVMASAPEGPCELVCLPILIPGAEAAPARAMIRVPS